MQMLQRALTSLPYGFTNRVLFGNHLLARPLQVLVQHLIGGPRSASFNLDGYTFHCSTSEKYFFEREQFEEDLWAVLRNILGPEDVVYDFGAHIGYWVLRLSRLCKHVVAFEPSPTHFARLSENAGSICNATLVNAAIDSQEGEMRFSEAGSMSTLGNGEILVRTTTLDAQSKRLLEPTFLMIDVEGHAGEALRGAANLLARRIPLTCEIHQDVERDAVWLRLKQHGYRIEYLGSRSYPFRILAR